MSYVNICLAVLFLGLILSLLDRYLLEKNQKRLLGYIQELSIEQAESSIGVQAVFEAMPDKQRKTALANFDRIKEKALEEIQSQNNS